MFPASYFVADYFSPRYFEPLGDTEEAVVVAVVQESDLTLNSGTPITIVLPGVTANSLLAVAVQCHSTAIRTFAVTDDKSNTWVEAIRAQDGGADGAIFYVEDAAAGDTTITITPNAAITCGALAYEISGVDTLDHTAQFNDITSSDNHYCAPVGGIDTHANVIVICNGRLTAAATSITAGSGYTESYTSTQRFVQYKISEAALVAERGAFTSVGTDRPCFGFMAAFYDSGVAPVIPTPVSIVVNFM